MECKVYKSGFIKHSVEMGEFSGDVPYYVLSKLRSNRLRFVQILVSYDGKSYIDAVNLFSRFELKDNKNTIWGILSKMMCKNQVYKRISSGKFFKGYYLEIRFIYSDNGKTIARLTVYNKWEKYEFEFAIFFHNLESFSKIWVNKLPPDLYSSITSVLLNSDISLVVKDKLLENIYDTHLKYQKQSRFNKYHIRSVSPANVFRVLNGNKGVL